MKGRQDAKVRYSAAYPMVAERITDGRWFSENLFWDADPADLFEMYRQKFSVSEYSFALRGLTYFDDAEDDPMPEMLEPVTWKDVKREIELKVREFAIRL